MTDMIATAISEHLTLAKTMEQSLPAQLPPLVTVLVNCLRSGGTIFWSGNGASAADSQHLAAELVGRFKRERRALASVALTTDTSVLTCLANDYSYEDVFARQVEALADKNDLLIG